MKRHRLDKRKIIRRSAEFSEIISGGRRVSSAHFSLFFQHNPSLKYGFAVSRKIGCAAKRNHAKRRTREIVRHHLHLLPADVRIVILAKPGVERRRFQILKDELVSLLKKVDSLRTRQ